MNWFLFIISSILLFSLPELESSEILSLTEELRIDRNLNPEQEEERQAQVREKILQSIQDIPSTYETLEEAVHAFIGKEIKNSNNYFVINSSDTEFHGNSKDEVFFLFDHKGKMQFVIKAFHNIEQSSSHFLPEISGNILINKMGYSSLVAPKLLAVAKYSNIEMCGFLLESAAKGERIDQIVYTIAAFAEDDDQRKIKFKEALKAFRKVGEAFARLHHTDESHHETLSKQTIMKVEDDLQKLEMPSIATKFQDKIDLENLKNFVREAIQEAQGISFAPSYQFGSAHLRNIFYDSKSDTVTLIDTGKLHFSVDYEGLPLADPAFDLIRIQEFLTRISLQILTEEETRSLVDALYAGYHKIRPLPDERLLRFYTIYLVLHKSITYSDFDTKTDPFEVEMDFHIFHEYLKLLNEMILYPSAFKN